MDPPREMELFPTKPTAAAEIPVTLQLFDEGPSTRGEQNAVEIAAPRYKGVVLQQNGNWGAQIYIHQGRIWLGTFKSEIAAARAYDSAAIKLNHGDSHRNFPLNAVTVHEPAFQDVFTTEAILEMIKEGSYESKLAEYVRAIYSSKAEGSGLDASSSAPAIICREMFQKELTPSDVGKLNRLVIPKKNATRYFPPVNPDSVEELLLEFRDRSNQSWVFRYCYWKSSQSYVFTKGWNKFVKDNELRARDVVVFYRCHEIKGGLPRRSFCLVDIVRGDGGGGGNEAGRPAEDVERIEVSSGSEEGEARPEKLMDVDDSGEKKKEMKLFGVWIR